MENPKNVSRYTKLKKQLASRLKQNFILVNYGLVTYFEKEHAEKCVNGKTFLDSMFGADIFVKWSHRNIGNSPYKSSSGSCTSTSNSSSYGPKSSASSTHKNERKKCQDPTCNQLLNYSPPQGKNFCPKCGLDQNFNAGEAQR